MFKGYLKSINQFMILPYSLKKFPLLKFYLQKTIKKVMLKKNQIKRELDRVIFVN